MLLKGGEPRGGFFIPARLFQVLYFWRNRIVPVASDHGEIDPRAGYGDDGAARGDGDAETDDTGMREG